MIHPDYYYYWHIAKASLLAAITTLFLIIERTRFTFRQTRRAYVAHLQQHQQQNHNHGGKAAIIFETTKKNSKSRNKNANQGLKKKAVDVENSNDNDSGTFFVIGFFHPHCSAGGGGERVLWKFIQTLGELKEEAMFATRQHHRRSKTKKNNETKNIRSNRTSADGDDKDDDVIRRNCRNMSVVVYTVDEPTENYDQDIMEKVRERFSIVISSSLHIQFVHLHEIKCFLGKLLARFGQCLTADDYSRIIILTIEMHAFT